MSTDIEFDKLTPAQQEAYIARGEYKDPKALDQGNAPEGAPSGPLPYDDDSVGKAPAPEGEIGKPKKSAAKKRS